MTMRDDSFEFLNTEREQLRRGCDEIEGYCVLRLVALAHSPVYALQAHFTDLFALVRTYPFAPRSHAYIDWEVPAESTPRLGNETCSGQTIILSSTCFASTSVPTQALFSPEKRNSRVDHAEGPLMKQDSGKLRGTPVPHFAYDWESF